MQAAHSTRSLQERTGMCQLHVRRLDTSLDCAACAAARNSVPPQIERSLDALSGRDRREGLRAARSLFALALKRPDVLAGCRKRLVGELARADGMLRCELLRLLPHTDWPPHRRRGLLMVLLHALQSTDPETRLAGLDGLHAIHAQMPRLRPVVEHLLDVSTRVPCRSTSLHAARLLDQIQAVLSSR